MAIPSGSYGYIVVKSDWILHEAVQLLLSLRRDDAVRARSAGYHLLEAKILDDSSFSGILAEIEIPRQDRNGETGKFVTAQVLVPWSAIQTVACFSEEAFGDVKRGIGFRPAPKGS